MQWQVIPIGMQFIRYEEYYNNFRSDNYFFFDKNKYIICKIYTIHTYT